MSDTSRRVVRGGCLGSVLGGLLGALMAGGLVTIGFAMVASEPAPGPHLFTISRWDGAAFLGFLAAFPGAFVGAVVGAIRGARNVVVGPSADPGDSSEEELARLRKRVEELEGKTTNEAITRKDPNS